jgi:hypothetical protein
VPGSEEGDRDNLGPEVEALRSIDKSLREIARVVDPPADRAFRSVGLDAESIRDDQRARREAQMVRFYKLTWLSTTVAAGAAIAAVIVAAVSA